MTSTTYSPDNYYPPTPDEMSMRETELLTAERISNMVKIVREKRIAEEAYNKFIQSLIQDKDN